MSLHRGFKSLAAATFFIGSASPAGLHAKVGSYWRDLPLLPTPRQEVGVAADGANVYVIGGILDDRSATGAVERFNTNTETWEKLPSLPENVRVHHVGAASAAGLVFAIGGLDSSFRAVKSVFAFDLANSAWERKADLPQPRGATGVAAIEEKIYVAGGQDGAASFADLFVYDALADRWEALRPMPTARNHLAATAMNGIFYAVGGRAGGLLDKLEAYNPASSRWVELEPMPTARGGIAAAGLRDCIFVFGGEGNEADPSGVFPQVEGYDTCANHWMSDLDMAHPRHGIGAVVVGDYIYIPGGSAVEGFGVTDVNDLFFPGGGSGGFLRGDSNLDAALDISDTLYTLAYLFLGGKAFGCEDAADTNDNGTIDLSDAVFGLNYLFLGGPRPPIPGPEVPGLDPTTGDLLGCSEFPRPRCFEP